MSPNEHVPDAGPVVETLAGAKARKLAGALAPLVNLYAPLTVLDVLVLLKVSEKKDISPSELADALGLPLVRSSKIVYALEKGRGDNDKKALGLLEVHADTTPGRRMYRMIRLSPKGKAVVASLLAATAGGV